MSIGKNASSGGLDISSTAKQYKVSRRRVLLNTFAQAAIRRRMFQVCSLSQTLSWHWWWIGILTVTMIHLAVSRLIQLQALSNNIDSSNGMEFLLHPFYSAWLFLAVALLHAFVDTEKHCLESQ